MQGLQVHTVLLKPPVLPEDAARHHGLHSEQRSIPVLPRLQVARAHFRVVLRARQAGVSAVRGGRRRRQQQQRTFTMTTGSPWNMGSRLLLSTMGIMPKYSISHVRWQSTPRPGGLMPNAALEYSRQSCS
jgi:hypothetical protein